MENPNKSKGELRKPAKTMAGVTPLAVAVKPKKCNHGTCIYCPGGNEVPQSYTIKSPAVMRALMLMFNPYKQVRVRLKAFKAMNHPTDKIELIIIGGTFLQYPDKYKYWFVKRCYDALNNKTSKTLEQAKKLNEKTKNRCVAFCIENRPDNCTEKDIKQMLDFGVTRVELGVQILDDQIYKKVNRGHTVKDVIDASKRLKDAGFKIGYHIMPGLPGSSFKKDLKLFKKVFLKQEFKPDQLKLYPCQLVKDSPLEKMTLNNKIIYEPYSEQETKKILAKMISLTPEYCRVMRIMREIPQDQLVKGLKRIDLRAEVEKEIKNSRLKNKIKEIRMREIGFNQELAKNKELKLKIKKYKSSNGIEYFLQYVNKYNILFGLLRLRILKNKLKPNKFTKTNAVIRELHVYGKSLKINQKLDKKTLEQLQTQHQGLGKKLIKKAEEITKKHKIDKLAIISGVGVREYYKKLGYSLDKNKYYMIKEL